MVGAKIDEKSTDGVRFDDGEGKGGGSIDWLILVDQQGEKSSFLSPQSSSSKVCMDLARGRSIDRLIEPGSQR